MDFVMLLLVFSGLFVGWTIGANDAANCLGTSVGAGLLTYRKAAWVAAVLAVIGAAAQGSGTMNTMGKGIVDSALLNEASIIAVLLAAAVLVTALTLMGLPASTTQAVVGGITGVAVMQHVTADWAVVAKIFACGFGTALLSLALSFVIYKLYYRLVRKSKFLFVEKILGWIVLLSGGFLAYGLGANNIGNAMGLIVGKGMMTALIAGIIGGLAIGIGSVSLGKRVMKSVGSGITQLNAPMAFAAQMGAALAVFALTLLAIPTSTTFGIVGAIAGVGMVKGTSAVDKKTLKGILFGWFATPFLGAAMAVLALLLVRLAL